MNPAITVLWAVGMFIFWAVVWPPMCIICVLFWLTVLALGGQKK